MACNVHLIPSCALRADVDSDYGSELDDDAIEELLTQAKSQPLEDLIVQEGIEEPILKDDPPNDQPLVRLARVRDTLSQIVTGSQSASQHLSPPSASRRTPVEVEYDESNRTTFSPTHKPEEALPEPPPAVEPSVDADTRSPIERFRTAPKKNLSVTDLISPAWCEQQYWYSLTKYGRIRRTPAMKQGSSVHKVLEEQVHTEVPIDVRTREDRFALRIWNIIQGLRTLRRTGMTRELEVWGIVDGEVVNGIIDEITTECPDEQMEQRILDRARDSSSAGKKRDLPPADQNQRTLTEFLTSSQTATVLEHGKWPFGSLHEKPHTLYLVDVKTRQSKSVPTGDGGQLRPVHMQLMLYHRLLSALAANQVSAEHVFQRYNVQPHVPFSDTFIAQIGQLDFAFPEPPADAPDAYDEGPVPRQEDPIDTILANNTLEALWSLMMTEFQSALPPTSLSALLTAEYRTASDGAFLGRRSFAFDAAVVQTYVADEMRWWKGERETKGVELEEAYKCRMCEFASTCTWRLEKVEEGIQKARLRNGGRRRSEI